MNKYLYKIKDLEVPPWLKYWFARKSKVNFDLSEILNGSSFDLTDTVNKKLHLINIFGNSVQNGEPTPENPIEVKSSGDNGYITEKIVNENLLDFSKMKSSSNTTFTFIDNVLTISSERGAYNNANIEITNLIKSNKGKILSFGYNDIIEVGSVVKSFQLIITNQENRNSYYAFQSYNYSYNIPNDVSDIKKVTFQISQNNRPETHAGTLIVEKPILYFGEVKPTYVEHQEQVFTIPCQQPMRAIGNVKDTFVKVNGVWYERHNIKREIARGNQNWWKSNSNLVDRYYKNLDDGRIYDSYSSQKSYCNNYTWKYNIGDINTFYLGSYQEKSRIFINYSDIGASTLQDFKDFLEEKFNSNEPLYYDYELKESIDLPCTQAQITALEQLQKAKTYNGVTHIYSDDEVSAELQIQYYKEKGE